MKQFELISGRHVDLTVENKRSVRVYEKGDIVQSEKDLAKMFPGKFKVIGEASVAAVPGDRTSAIDKAWEEEMKQEAEAPVKAKPVELRRRHR